MNRRLVFETLDPSSTARRSRLFRGVHRSLLALGLVVVVAGTTARFAEPYGWALNLIWSLLLAYFAAEYAARLLVAAEGRPEGHDRPWLARRQWAFSANGIVDLLALAPVVALVLGATPSTARLFSVVWVLKLARYSKGMAILARVIPTAGSSLLSVLVAFVIVLLGAATIAHVLEGEAQPDAYGSIPAALWWTVVTLTTTGYGDVTPQTFFGRLLAGVVMISGIAVFALWAGILATAFADEMRRYNFLRTWDLVAKVPMLRDVGAPLISDVARLLRSREVPGGATIMRVGEPGDCMYFIVAGEVEVRTDSRPVRLAAGDFFGEIALVSNGPRTATVAALTPCSLLVLDVADFRDLAGRHPELIRVIEAEAARRAKEAAEANRPRV